MKHQINCYYVSGTKFSDKLEAYLQASKKDVLLTDISKTMPSDTQWHEIADRLGMSLKDIMNTETIDGFDEDSIYEEEDLVKILAQNPEVLEGAILIENERAAHIKNYTEVLEFFGVDSAGIEKTFHYEETETKTQTEDENFI